MFNVNDTVIYGTYGACKIVKTEEKDFFGTKKNYMVLKPLYGNDATYYVPLDNEELFRKMHKILSADEIDKLIDSAWDKRAAWIVNDRERKEYYKNIIADADHCELIRLVIDVSTEKERLEANDKKLSVSDERFLRDAERLLHNEFRYVLDIPDKELISYIRKRKKNK